MITRLLISLISWVIPLGLLILSFIVWDKCSSGTRSVMSKIFSWIACVIVISLIVFIFTMFTYIVIYGNVLEK